MPDLDKRAAEEFIVAFIWVASHADEIKTERQKGNQTLESLTFWVERAIMNPHDFYWTNGLTVAVMTIQGVFQWGPGNPSTEAKIRHAMERMYPQHYPKVEDARP